MLVLLHICQCSGSFSVACSGLAAWKSSEIQDIGLFLKLVDLAKLGQKVLHLARLKPFKIQFNSQSLNCLKCESADNHSFSDLP